MNILVLLVIIVVAIAAIKFIAGFAVGVARSIAYIGLGLLIIYVIVTYKDQIMAFIQGFAK